MLKKVLIFVIGLLVFLLVVLFVAGPAIFDDQANSVSGSPRALVSQEVSALHDDLWIADLHADALLWNRDLTVRNDRGHVDIPRLIAGNIALQAFTIVSKTPYGLNFERNDDTTDMITTLAIAQRWPISTWTSLKARARYQAEKLQRFAAASNGQFRVITTKSELVQYLEERSGNRQLTAGFLGIEGAQVLEGELSNLKELFAAGFRMMAPSHFFDTEVGGSAHGMKKGGLTQLGREVIREMENLGMLVDLAHASPQTIDDALAISTRPVVVSHTGVRGTCDNVRNLSDEHLKGIAATGGVIGIAFFEQATCGSDVTAIIRAIRYTVDLVGADCVALGSDFDGTVQTPFDAAGIVQLTQALRLADFSPLEIRKIMGENVRRVLLATLP